MRLHQATSLLCGGSAVFASLVDAERIASHVPAGDGDVSNSNTQRTQGRGGQRRDIRHQLKRQVRSVKAVSSGIRLKAGEEPPEDHEADIGILSYSNQRSSKNDISHRFLQDRDFCECVEYGYAIEDEQCFNKAVAGCKLEGPYVDSPPTGCSGPYIATYCQYYECLDGTFGGFDAFQAATYEAQQACRCAYYAAACYLCSPSENGEDPIISPDDDFCENMDADCQVSTCCENAPDSGGKSVCVDQHLRGDDDSDGPTFEPTMEAPDLGSFEPTLSPTKKARDTPVPTATVTVTKPSSEEVVQPTPGPSFITTTSSPTAGDTTSSPEPTLPEPVSPPSTSAAGNSRVVCGVSVVALAGYISLFF